MAKEPEYTNPLQDSDLLSAYAPRVERRRFSMRWLLLAAVLLLAVGTYFFGIQPRLEARADLKKETASATVTSVAVIKPKTANAVQELILPGRMQPFSETAIYARTPGYLKRWYADIGKRVKAGELLAEIDAPELDDQLAAGEGRPCDSGSKLPVCGIVRRALGGFAEVRFGIAPGSGRKAQRRGRPPCGAGLRAL